MARSSEWEIEQALLQLPSWSRVGDAIVRDIQLPSFAAVIALVNRIAELAEAADHHPDMDIRYRTLRLALTTHDAGGLTAKDFDLARQIDERAH